MARVPPLESGEAGAVLLERYDTARSEARGARVAKRLAASRNKGGGGPSPRAMVPSLAGASEADLEGWSSEEEDVLQRVADETGEADELIAKAGEVDAAASSLFSDAAPEFSEVRHVRRRFVDWAATHSESYEKAYIGLCLPTLLSPLVRLQLLEWKPLESGSIEELHW